MFAKQTDTTKLGDIPPVDRNGKPTTYLSFLILELMLSQPKRWFSVKELSRLLAARLPDVDLICRQLKRQDLLAERPSQPGRYQYNWSSENVDLQIGFETFLIDVELESLPVHLTLPYSPSFRRSYASCFSYLN